MLAKLADFMLSGCAMRVLLIISLLQFVVLTAAASPSCRFAWNYTQADLLSSASARESYLYSAAYWEGHFHQPYVSYNPKNCFTCASSCRDLELF